MPELHDRPTDPAAADLGAFADRITTLDRDPQAPVRPFFDHAAPIALARAPGRLDVMGGIADYSGSLVLQWPIREATCAAIQEADGGTLQIVSLPGSPGGTVRSVVLSAPEFAALVQGGYDDARALFQRVPDRHWASYVAGPIAVLLRERPACNARAAGGLRVVVQSDVPEGKGVSSSAALEVATLQALAGILGEPIDGVELARLCQIAENFIVGAPCGIMDQMTAALGREHQLLAMLCQPAEVRGFVPVPPGIGFWGIDSGIRHSVTGTDYTSVRTGAFMGYRILADLAGRAPSGIDDRGAVRFDDPPWGGYLANLDPSEFEASYAARLPETIAGAEFLRRYGGTTDLVTRVEPDRNYAVRRPTAHPIHEHARVRRFAALLDGPPDETALREMGTLMYDSHASYSACGLGSEGTDRLVELVRAAGPEMGLYGAKITGGGSGGTVAVLGRADAGDAVAQVAERYSRETGRQTSVFSGSSPGACAVGVRVLNR